MLQPDITWVSPLKPQCWIASRVKAGNRSMGEITYVIANPIARHGHGTNADSKNVLEGGLMVLADMAST